MQILLYRCIMIFLTILYVCKFLKLEMSEFEHFIIKEQLILKWNLNYCFHILVVTLLQQENEVRSTKKWKAFRTVARARPIGVHVRPHIMRNLLPTSDKSIHFRKWLALWKWLWKSRVHASLTLVTATASPSHSNSPRDIGREALRLEFFENTTAISSIVLPFKP